MENSKFGTAFTRLWGMVVTISAFWMAGCGGGGGSDSGSSNPPPNNPPPSQFAPSELAATALTLNVAGEESRRIEFSPDGQSWAESGNEGESQGTYNYSRASDGNTATVVLQANEAETLQLVFASEHSGTFSYTGGRSGAGSFTLEDFNPDPGEDPDGGGNNPPPDDGIPTSLSGRTMFGTRTFTSTGPTGQTHVYTFSGNNFHDSDPPEESDGNYTYSVSGNTARLLLNYTSPREFRGDRHELDMVFTSDTRGTFTSTYTRGDGTAIVINGDFEIE